MGFGSIKMKKTITILKYDKGLLLQLVAMVAFVICELFNVNVLAQLVKDTVSENDWFGTILLSLGLLTGPVGLFLTFYKIIDKRKYYN